MKRLLRVPFVLVFAALWGIGSYALGFQVLADNVSVALGAAFTGGIVVTGTLGSLTSRPGAVLLGLPLAIVALTTAVYAAGIHHMHTLPRMTMIEPGSAVLTTARVTVPLLVAYTVLLAGLGALDDAATVRRFRRHMAS
ncbi:hypothetical protein [Dactylosporangium sp. CS-033363]|uniref:hypothetical protein n=1 Tax=Dactylosporangium sp. CS-033363 TaxID=3239935 RepID=UPI003D89BCF6